MIEVNLKIKFTGKEKFWLSLFVLLVVCVRVGVAVASESCSENINKACLKGELAEIITEQLETSGINWPRKTDRWSPIISALDEYILNNLLSIPSMESVKASHDSYQRSLGAIGSLNGEEVLTAIKSIELTAYREMALIQWMRESHKKSGFSYLLKQLALVKSDLGFNEWWQSAIYAYYLSVKWVQLDTAKMIERELIQSALAQEDQKNSMILDVVYAALIGGDASKAKLLMTNMQLSNNVSVPIIKRREAYLDLAELQASIQKNNLGLKRKASNLSELMSEWTMTLNEEQRVRLRQVEGEMSDELRLMRHQYIIQLLQSRYHWYLPEEDPIETLSSLTNIHLVYAYHILNSIDNESASAEQLEHKAYWLALLIAYLPK